jgi:hypothetical protein
MVKPTEYGNGLDPTMYLPRPRDWLLLGERLMRARPVVEAREFNDEISHMLPGQNEAVIEKFAAYGATIRSFSRAVPTVRSVAAADEGCFRVGCRA